MKKTAQTKQKKTMLIGRRQWMVVALLVVLLLALGFAVYGADQVWLNR